MSLSQKVLFFLAVMLAFQLMFISALFVLQSAAEEQTKRATRARHVATVVSEILGNVSEGITAISAGRAVGHGTHYAETTTERLNGALKKFTELKNLTRDNETEYAKVVATENILITGISILGEVRQDFMVTGPDGGPARNRLWSKLKQLSDGDIFKNLHEVAAEEESVLEQDPLKQEAFRAQLRTIILAAVVLAIIFILGLARYITAQITSRLGVMHDNAYRLASNLPLNEPVEGNDEIAVLDHTFHEMASHLREAREKERAIIDNAQDIICSLNKEGNFASINPAVKRMLGYEAEELLGTKAVDLLSSQDVSKALTYFFNVQEGRDAGNLEVPMVHADGHVLDTLWSAHWSTRDQSLFCVIHDLSERMQAERLKEEVMAMVNHDLRTPLTTMRVSLEIFGESEKGKLSPKGEALLQRMAINCDQILRLTQDLLDVDRLEGGHMVLDIERCNLSDIINRSLELTHGLAHTKGIAVQCQSRSLFVQGDSKRLEQVVTNILGNAIKFSPDNSTVNIKCDYSSDGKMAVVMIRDQGPGIESSMLEAVFDRYRQVKQKNSHGGSGLGLAIARGLIQQHGGKIWVESQFGQGSTFIFTVPLFNS